MGLGSKRWKCKNCGRKHRSDRKQCVECGYSVLAPVDGDRRGDRLTTILLGLLPALLAVLTVGLIAWALFF